MKTIKSFLQIILIVVLAGLIIAYFLPNKNEAHKTISIKAGTPVIFTQLNDLLNWQRWMSWNETPLPQPEKLIKHAWGENAGISWGSVPAGQILIKKSLNDSLLAELNFKRSGPYQFNFHVISDDNNESTSLRIQITKTYGANPLARWKGLFEKGNLKKNTRDIAVNLKIVAETLQTNHAPVIEVSEQKSRPVLAIRKKLTQVAISNEMGKMFEILNQRLETKGLTITGLPYSIYHKIEGDSVDFEVGYPVNKLTSTSQSILSYQLPQQLYASSDHVGNFEDLGPTHQAIQTWINQHDYQIIAGPMEQYINTGQSTNSAPTAITIINYPIR